mmetsp:Transcript_8891/g.12293  ORF Transcript_8891/g.12293 Transcript_8891/m.12293 type:complete len:176 (-) Transcript_8891:237-764(-)|eukprot:CAMPEP_0185729866 /NCGR_PEP_ID=MMETSP1171-20130828/7614_1 /TAXON_ID=374046 /ORGANISM="Helicotheca tamensis, Strain CCMP826" /LENGTH=175 /DNA_ID=CAMNT_0028398799 /DNA_START=114 /DNA_END=641 /DNA_ORIENTATION=-
MSRAFHPPDTLSKDEIRQIADVRRDIWKNGFYGLFVGSLSGYVIHSASKFIHGRMSDAAKMKIHAPGDVPIKFSRNTAFLCVMVGGAVGSFTMATAAGKNSVHNLHDVFEVGKTPTGTDYQKSLQRAQMREEEIKERERRRILRRQSVQKRLEEGHGLSDSHGGHWVENGAENNS